MKTTIIVAGVILGAFVLLGVAEASKALIKGVEFAQVGISKDAVYVSRVIDPETKAVCYVTRSGTNNAHDISCVK